VPIIGWMNDLENMTVDDARVWYEQLVRAEQRLMSWSLVTSTMQTVFELAEQHYGTLPARQLPVRKPQDEPPQVGSRRLTVKAPADLPVVLMAYKVPVIRDVDQDVDPYALELLSAVLAGHEAARFSRHLVREQRLAVDCHRQL
jgi:zinc protease